MFASSYEIYDRFSKPFQRFLDSLTVTYIQNDFKTIADAKGMTLFEGPRGSPANVGTEIAAVHPVVRTNPVTGWKSTFVTGPRYVRINDVSDDENDMIMNKINQILTENEDLKVRLRWKDPGDIGMQRTYLLLPAVLSFAHNNTTVSECHLVCPACCNL